MKKALFIATVHSFFDFEKSDITILKEMGYEVHIAANMRESELYKDDGHLDYLGLIKHQVDFGRNPFSTQSYRAYRQLKEIMSSTYFDLIHTHTPVASAISRLAARKTRKKGTKVIYTDHGFHFHKSSGLKNWMLYYPVEYLMSYYTDMILTINKEDYAVIQHFHTKEKRYIPGVGVDVQHISALHPDQDILRQKYGLPANAFVLISVGELSVRKNQEVVIRAIADIGDKNIYYLLCGDGAMRSELQQLVEQLGVSHQVVFAGSLQHEEVLALNHVADVAMLPSLIEGLGLAGIEALAAGIPVIASGVHGIKDYVIDGETGIRCNPHSVDDFKNAIARMHTDTALYSHCCEQAAAKAQEFDINKVKELMKQNYKDIVNE